VRGASELAHLLAAGLLPVLAYTGLGLWMLRLLPASILEEAGGRRSVGAAERAALAFALGSGAASLLLLGLRSLSVPGPLPAARCVLGGRRAGEPKPDAQIGRWPRAVDAATLALGLAAFLAALAPETSWDGFEYHLPMIQAWADGPIRALPAMLDSEFRAGVDLLAIPTVAAGQPDAAAGVSAAFAACLAALVRGEATRRAGRAAGALTGWFVLAVPFTLVFSVSAYVDLGVGVYGFVALSFADRWNRRGVPASLVVSALALGFAANAKLHAAVLGPSILLLLCAGGRPPGWSALLRFASLAGALALPWFIKAWLTTGNPFFPILGAWLGYGPTTAENLRWKALEVHHYIALERSVTGFARYLLAITFTTLYHIGGMLGPLPLALGPWAAPPRERATRALVAVIALLLPLQFLFMPAVRFGSPLLPFYAVAAAVGGVRLARSGDLGRSVLGVALATLALFHAASAAQDYVPRIAALRDPRAYERAVFPDQDALRDTVAELEPVVAIPKGAVSWMPKPVYVLHWTRNGELFFDNRTPPREAHALLRRRGVRSLVIDVSPARIRPNALGHPLVDAWLRGGGARLRADVARRPADDGRVWVALELLGPPGAYAER
jgi:hypothetical protein